METILKLEETFGIVIKSRLKFIERNIRGERVRERRKTRERFADELKKEGGLIVEEREQRAQ